MTTSPPAKRQARGRRVPARTAAAPTVTRNLEPLDGFKVAFDGKDIDEFIKYGFVSLDSEINGDMPKLRAVCNLIMNNITTSNWNGRQISLQSNNIGVDGALAIAEALQKNNTLTTIHLDRNDIGDSGAGSVAVALQKNDTLKTISLDGNGIGAEGARAISEVLANNKSLTTFAFGNNNIGDDGARAIAKALEKNNTLTKIFLNSNNIGVDGIRANADSLQKNSTLKVILLTENSIQKTDKEKLKQSAPAGVVFNI
eukprot:m.122266 g.122266  ORF g.122266 m.122266 type:complete len:256 (+) comp14422_c0_seq5:559-1326(+)